MKTTMSTTAEEHTQLHCLADTLAERCTILPQSPSPLDYSDDIITSILWSSLGEGVPLDETLAHMRYRRID